MFWNRVFCGRIGLSGLFVTFVCCLTACQSTLDNNISYALPATANVAPGLEIVTPILPGVAIKGAKPKVILDAVVRERAKKRMWVSARSLYSLTMVIKVPHTQKRTEAQMIYTLYRYQQNLWLSAKVYQVVEPGTKQENRVEVTSRVVKEIQVELNKIAEQFIK